MAIQSMIETKEKQLHDFIRNNKDVLIKFGTLKNELADLKQKRFEIAELRILHLLKEGHKHFNSVLINQKKGNSKE